VLAKTLIVRLEATVLDELGVTAPAVAHALVDPTAAFNDVLGVLNTWAGCIDSCSDGQVLSVRLDVLPTLPSGLKSSPVAGSRVEQVGLLQFNSTGTTHVDSVDIPALSGGPTVVSGGRIVLTSGAPCAVLRDFLTGGGTAALQWTNAWQQAISSFAAALISFRSAGRALARDTYERAL
jgi:hypothetical protein